MAVIKWKEEYSTQIPQFDEQHKKLVEIINHLYEEMRQKKGDEVLKEIFSELEEYTKEHFSDEEMMMEKHAFPELEGHKEKHSELIATLTELKQGYADGTGGMTAKTFTFLRDWLLNHIVEVDKKYGLFLKENGIE